MLRFMGNRLRTASQLAKVKIIKIDSLGRNSTTMVRDFTYPVARRDESVVDNFHGTKVTDPYRWLENPDSEETKQFVEAENKITQPFLENCDKWQKINTKLTALCNYPKYTVPDRHGNYYFSYKNSGLQNQNVLYKQRSLKDEPALFFDPNTLSADGTIAVQGTAFSEDGSLFAYGLCGSGSDWMKIKIRNVETGKDYSDLLERVKFSLISWTHDNKGIFYCRYPDQQGNVNGLETVVNENQKIYYHRIGETQDEDVLVAEFPENPSWRMITLVSDCGKYLIVSVFTGAHDNLLYVGDLGKNGDITGKIPLMPLVTEFEADYHYVTNSGSKMVFRTNNGAPNYRLVVIDLNNYAKENWGTLVEEHPKNVLSWALCVDQDKLLIGYIDDVKSALQVHSLASGKLVRKFPLEIGTIIAMTGSKKHSEIFYQLMSFLTPGTIYQYDFTKPELEPTLLQEVKLNLEGFDKNNFSVEQVFYPSRDGTKIPMFIIQKKTENKGPKPCLMYGYGGFNISLQPFFGESFLFFIDAFDGILAVPNIRGGGEYGEKWHDGGRLLNKQNSFDDFQAATEYLVQHKYTEHKKIAIQGGSNGGLLVGASINQRPDSFGAAIAQVGVMDLLRFHKFTIGHAWMSDYGNPDEKVHFDNLYKLSPLHNVQSPDSSEKQYPSTLILTADHDDRVNPSHSFKLAAAIHNAIKDNQFQKNPILLRVYGKAGHGQGKPISKEIEESTDILTFLYLTLHIDADL